jgi:glycosyltransferase involved in cell wall biosynthesis
MRTFAVKATVVGRLAGERQLAHAAHPEDTVLCFGNLPPLFRVAARVHVLLQNRYLLRARDLSGFSMATRVRISLERRWLRARVARVDRMIVQSASMAREVKTALGREAAILPFTPPLPDPEPATGAVEARFDYLYVASGEPHKNHARLLEAWALLAREGLTPSLGLTLDRSTEPEACDRVQRHARTRGTRVAVVTAAGPDGLADLYRSAGALIYPSLFESLGLPLLEARRFGLPILAAERDYVRDVVDPEETFDPESAVSIARAVRRHLGENELRVAVLTSDQFLERLLSL